jgi:hypothetical protein
VLTTDPSLQGWWEGLRTLLNVESWVASTTTVLLVELRQAALPLPAA